MNLHPDFVKPAYHDACFCHLPQLVTHLLTGQGSPGMPARVLENIDSRYKKVALLFVDAFGWHFLERYRDKFPALQQLTRHGQAHKMTAMFPSTTSAHVTTIHTGLPPAQSGVFEWYYYDPVVDSMISPLLFSFAGDKQRNSMLAAGVKATDIFPNTTLYQTLGAAGIQSRIYQSSMYSHGPYSEVVFNGAEVFGYHTTAEALYTMQRDMHQDQGPGYYFLYFAQIDSIAHVYSPNSPQFEAEAEAFFTLLQQQFLDKVADLDDTLLIITADHGQVTIDPQQTRYLNHDPNLAGYENYLRHTADGRLMIPAGSARDFFLYVKPGLVDEAHQFFSAGLANHSEVYKINDLIEAGIFGPQPVSQAFLERVGDLVILPHGNNNVAWYVKDKFEVRLHGMHGGLSPAEMETPLILYPLG